MSQGLPKRPAKISIVPAMISYHLPAETMDILAGRLGNPWLIYDQVTDKTVNEMKNLEDSKKLSVSKFINFILY